MLAKSPIFYTSCHFVFIYSQISFVHVRAGDEYEWRHIIRHNDLKKNIIPARLAVGSWVVQSIPIRVHEQGKWFNIKMQSYQHRRSHCGYKTAERSSYFLIGISYTGKWHRYIKSAPRSHLGYWTSFFHELKILHSSLTVSWHWKRITFRDMNSVISCMFLLILFMIIATKV